MAADGKFGSFTSAFRSRSPAVYVACGLSAAAVVTVLINSLVSYYAMWILAGVIFALAVYYTVKQL